MKLGTTLFVCAASAIGTALALDHVMDGAVKQTLIDCIKDRDLLDEEFGDFELDDNLTAMRPVHMYNDTIVALTSPDCPEDAPHDHVLMPINDAVNLYQIIKDSIGQLDPENQSDHALFGDKAISFERLYDAIEEDIANCIIDRSQNPNTTSNEEDLK